jgi:imidazolonepropionase-like amidohydrolase
MTINPARIAEIADVRGSIEPGRAADLVVFSADPLRLDARIIAVFVAGEQVVGDRALVADASPGGGT